MDKVTVTEAQLFEQLGRMTAENVILRRENVALKAEIEQLRQPQMTGAKGKSG